MPIASDDRGSSSLSAEALSLWTGQMPLARAFWEYGIFYGFVVNFLASLLSLAMLVMAAPPVLAAFGLFVPAVYNLLVLVAVWRSAANYAGPRFFGIWLVA